MKPRAKSRWSPASSKPANSLPVLNAAAPRESGTPLRIPGLLFRRLAIASFTGRQTCQTIEPIHLEHRAPLERRGVDAAQSSLAAQNGGERRPEALLGGASGGPRCGGTHGQG
jgi:hypothetical protein